MEIKTTKFTEWDYWYDEQSEGKSVKGEMVRRIEADVIVVRRNM
jgi:hypothetical protein